SAASFSFFQAEDGIRAFHVTGVQTCALPISLEVADGAAEADHAVERLQAALDRGLGAPLHAHVEGGVDAQAAVEHAAAAQPRLQIGRASCRERVWRAIVAAALANTCQ